MSDFLTLVRSNSAIQNATRGGDAWVHITAVIDGDARGGRTSSSIAVSHLDREQCEHSITALKLQGFYASWEDEGRIIINVSWLPRVPR